MTHTTASTNNQPSFTLEDVQRARDAIEKLSHNNEWMLIAPDGRMWKGDAQRMFMVLAPHHPLLKGVNHAI